jgi:hypothetical protein
MRTSLLRLNSVLDAAHRRRGGGATVNLFAGDWLGDEQFRSIISAHCLKLEVILISILL